MNKKCAGWETEDELKLIRRLETEVLKKYAQTILKWRKRWGNLNQNLICATALFELDKRERSKNGLAKTGKK